MKKVIIGNKNRPHIKLSAGEGEPTRVISAIGLSPNVADIETEFSKAQVAINAGADLIDEESIVEPHGSELRELLLTKLNIPISTVPLFETCAKAFRDTKDALSFDKSDVIDSIQRQAEQGVDVMTLHIAYNKRLAKMMAKSKRVIPLTSRSGAILTSYMMKTGKENPYRVLFDEILDILSANNVVLSLGTALRPGSICDGLDQPFFAELFEQSKIVDKAWQKGVSVMVEAAGHVRIDQVQSYVKLSKEILNGAPLRSLGPTVCDVGAGYDHITGSIGGAIAAMHGCDFLTCTTRAEHLGCPRVEDIKEAVIAFRLASYIGDTAKRGDISKDKLVSKARRKGNWQTIWKKSLFGTDARTLHKEINPLTSSACSMCGPYCALRLIEKTLKR